MRILLLEDDKQLGPWIVDGLRKEGHVVDHFADGKDALIAAMQRDKKVEHGRLRFVLPDRLGHVELVGDIAEADVRQSLET